MGRFYVAHQGPFKWTVRDHFREASLLLAFGATRKLRIRGEGDSDL